MQSAFLFYWLFRWKLLFLATRVPADETRCSELHFPARCPNVIFMAKQADVYLYIYFIILHNSRPCTVPSSSSQTLCVSQPSSDYSSVSNIHLSFTCVLIRHTFILVFWLFSVVFKVYGVYDVPS